jgi:glycosyltransferase involved in cell wall biosynthesis
LPCIATDLPSHRDLIEAETTGLVVNPGSPAALEKAICRLLASPAEGVRMGALARQQVSQQRSLASSVEQYLRLFEKLGR